MPIIYTPPYDSPIEDVFVRNYEKYASTTANLLPQCRVKTLCGDFILDFVIQSSTNHRVGIECDGKDFHDKSRDEWRDAMILGDGLVDVIYRLRGSDINYNTEDVLYIMSKLEPTIFNVRAQANLKVLASNKVQELEIKPEYENYFFKYPNNEGTGFFRIESRRRLVPNGQRRFWQAAYQHAKSIGGGALDDVIKNYRSKSFD